ncbi:MAG: hypothetical protein CMI60_01565, partial [Parvibaculum sp.]|nr:hypothetical protein [Parvibaculum sp.]
MHKVIKFHADWCGPCKNYGPIFDKVTNRLTGDWKVEKYNIESQLKDDKEYKEQLRPMYMDYHKKLS